MHFTTPAAFIPLLLMSPLAQALGFAQVANACNQSVYLWSVSSNASGVNTIATGGMYSEGLRSDPASGGISLKITRSPGGLDNGSPQTIFAYSVDANNNVWYDLSDVFGDAFGGSRLTIVPSITTCPSIIWPVGVNPGGSQVKVCSANSNVTLTLCA